MLLKSTQLSTLWKILGAFIIQIYRMPHQHLPVSQLLFFLRICGSKRDQVYRTVYLFIHILARTSTKAKAKAKCVYIYSGNSTILVLDNRRWGADSTCTSSPPIPGAHSCGCPGQMFSAPICTVPRMAYTVADGNRLSKHDPVCYQVLPRPGSHLGHREIKPLNPVCSLRTGELVYSICVNCCR